PGRFLMLWAGQLTGLIGDSFNYVAVAWLVLQLTGSSLAVGSILATAAVPRGLLMLLGGAVNDWLSPRLTMVLSGLARAVVMGVLAALALAGIVVAAFGPGAALLGDAGGYAMAGVFALLVPGIVATAT